MDRPMQHIWNCECGHEWACEADDFRAGAVVECPSCKTIWACVRPKRGSTKWIPVPRELAEAPYYRLLDPPEIDEDEPLKSPELLAFNA
jgi:hypothetical protein